MPHFSQQYKTSHPSRSLPNVSECTSSPHVGLPIKSRRYSQWLGGMSCSSADTRLRVLQRLDGIRASGVGCRKQGQSIAQPKSVLREIRVPCNCGWVRLRATCEFFPSTGIRGLPLASHSSMKEERAALLIRCSSQEAELIRQAAKCERRTLSGFVLNAVLKYLAETERRQVRQASEHEPNQCAA